MEREERRERRWVLKEKYWKREEREGKKNSGKERWK